MLNPRLRTYTIPAGHLPGIGQAEDEQVDGERDQSAGISIQEAAAHLGVSEKTIRRRIKAGEIAAHQLPTSQGFEWRVDLDGQPAGQVPGQNGHLNGHAAQVDTPVAVQQPPQRDQALLEALRLVEKLQQQNLELSGRVGFYQAKNQDLEQRVLLLEAPKPPQGGVVTLERQEIPFEAASAPVGRFDRVEQMPETSGPDPARQPWYKRIFG